MYQTWVQVHWYLYLSTISTALPSTCKVFKYFLLKVMECHLCQNSFFSVVCDNVTLPESITVIYPFYHWKSSHESLEIQSCLQALFCYLW